jgi:glycosyltransferase involved in cell wall biosynthesis
MQIAVVDDRSPNGRSREIVERLAPARVEFFEQPRNVGLAGNWNTGIERARGEWVHIFHQDDLLMPGFYEKLGAAESGGPAVGAAFCRHSVIDAEGQTTLTSDPERPEPGVIAGWDALIVRGQRVRCPAIVVRRSTYERVGGFRTDLVFALDWEMWIRIAFAFEVWYEPEILASHREHDDNETHRLAGLDAQLPDIKKALRLVRDGASGPRRRMALESLYGYLVGYGWLSFNRGDRPGALRRGVEAARLIPLRADAWRMMALAATRRV